MEPAVAYIRVSTEEQAQSELSPEAQRQAVERYCKAHSLALVAVVEDLAVSGYKPLADRPGGRTVLSMLRRKEARHVVASKLDRMFRNAGDSIPTANQWNRKGYGLHLIDQGGEYQPTAAGRAQYGMNSVMAQWFRDVVSERTREALAVKRERGERISRHVPYGTQLADDGKHLEPNPDERRVLRRIANLRKAGQSYRTIAGSLNRKGVTTRKGTPWRHQYVANVLERASQSILNP